ncbi:MAG: hypothetical protein DRJ10_00135 [Bacteroidetes bacterium]|nr:MAG: hypothetical protein DRJ10_00070 [Bacteroidota bacterium]RLD84839.1 MAG: hypothetical protein DRJ10_00135 [Bacteroidota bacterium]
MNKLIYIIICVISITVLTEDLVGQKNQNSTRFAFKGLYSDALRSKMQEDYLVAINKFKACLELIPNSSASAYQLSLIYLKLNDPEKSKQYINYALKYDETNEWYIVQKSIIAGLLGDQKLYKKCYKLLNSQYPDNPVYSYELSILYFKEHEYSRSLELLNKMETDLGVMENISFLKNNIYFESKKYSLISDELTKLIYVYPDSVKYIDMLGEYFLSMQQINKSLDIYKNGLTVFVENKRLNIKTAKIYSSLKEYKIGYDYLIGGIGSQQLTVDKQYKIAGLYLSSTEINTSEKILIYYKFVESDITNESIENNFIQFLLDEKELSLAEKHIKKIFKRNKQNFSLWNSLFSIFIAQNRIEELNTYSEEAINYFPNQAIIYFYTGYSFFLLKDYENSSNILLTGLDYVIDNKRLELDFFLYLAESFHAQNLYKKSDKYFDKYLEIDSLNEYLLNNYAYYLTQRNEELDKAYLLSRKSIEIEPFNASFLDTYAWIYYLKSDFKNALFHIKKAYKYGGKSNPVICEHFGDILLKNNEIDNALIKWKESLKLSPNNSLLLKKIQSFN